MAVEVQQPQRQQKDPLGTLLGVAQVAGPIVSLVPGGQVIGPAMTAGSTALQAIRQPQEQPMEQPTSGQGSISRRLEASPSRQQSLMALREAQEAVNQLPEEQRAMFQRPIGLALQQV